PVGLSVHDEMGASDSATLVLVVAERGSNDGLAAARQGIDCDDAIPIDLTAGSASINGQFGGAGDEYRGTCGAHGPDRVYAIELAAPSDLIVRDLGESHTMK